jgi:hypothetical protein
VRNQIKWLLPSSALILFLSTFTLAVASFTVNKTASSRKPVNTSSSKLPGQGGKPISGVAGQADRSSVITFSKLQQKEEPAQALTGIDEPEPELTNKTLPPDAVIQRESNSTSPATNPTAPSPSPSSSFAAIGDNNSYIPPDTQGAVGPNQLMVTLNSQVSVQTRAGSTVGTTSLNSFWASLGHSSIFDPRVLYDRYSDRWIFVSLADYRSTTSAVLVSASQTNDPNGSWKLYGIGVDASGQNFADYPIIGLNKDWIVVTVNVYRISDKGFVTANVYILNKANLYAGGSGAFTLLQDASGNSMAPAVTFDNTSSTVYLVENWNGSLSGSGYLRISTITGPVGSEVLNSGVAFPATANPWSDSPPGDGNFAPQLGSTQKINNGDSVIQNVVYRNGSLWCAQTVFLPAGSPTRSAIQWWQLSTGGSIQQRGRIDDLNGALFYGFPSIAVNQNNDALIGYSRFSSSQYASANYSFRSASDAPNALRDEVVLKVGEAPYYKTSGSTRNKWGDLSSSLVDPANDADFWTVEEYAAAPVGGIDRWGTWWGRISPAGPQTSPSDIVLYASEAAVRIGSWMVVADSTAAGGARVWNPDAGAPKLAAPVANPSSYFEMTFNAQASTAYRLWIRGKAQGDSPYNDSVFFQFSTSVDVNGTPIYRIGTTSGTTINLEDDLGAGLSGWGWQDNGWGTGVMGPLIYFQSSGSQTLRVQPREDGLSIDQIVLSPSTYLNSAPGALKNDITILPKQGGGALPPTITSISPISGTTAGGTSTTISGGNFLAGASVKFGGVAATNINLVNSGTISAATPAHASGAVNVTVTNADGQTGTLVNGFTYVAPTPMPRFGHVFMVVEENHSYESVVGSASMPYLNGLANRYGLAINYYADTHPSIGNYFMMTTGQIITNDDNFSGTVSSDNIVRELTLAGKTWRTYAESLPSVGYTGGDAYPYVKRHNPFVYLSDVIGSSTQANNVVPFSQLSIDLANGQLSGYGFIIPNQQHNAHDCPASIPNCIDSDKLAAADNWLSMNIQPLISSAAFQQDGLLIITFDESVDTDTTHGGGHIATVVISSRCKAAFRSSSFYQHENVLRTMAETLGLINFPGASAGALNMGDFIETAAPTISAISPSSGSTNGGTQVTLSGSHFSAGLKVNIGGSAATNVIVIDNTRATAITPPHASGTVNVTVTNGDGQSAVLAAGFTYTASSPPASNIVLYASEAQPRVGNWVVAGDSTAAGGARIWNPDAGMPKIVDPLANPADYFEMTFTAQAGTAYRLWIRGKAQNDFWGNDSVFLQFSDSVDNNGAAAYRIGTTSATTINLEDCSGCGLSGWGWQDNGWGVGIMGPLLYFAGAGTHTLRVQVREDGLSIDQIVLSPNTYLNASPGALKNDTTILPKT